MNKLYDVLEICLQELENGADLETVLAHYPDLASELRPILKASMKARMRSLASAPSPEVMRRGRAKLLQKASEMREQKAAPRKRMIPIFQRLAISFTLTALFLASGTSLVGASSSALPGEKLYPVKRTWEDLRLFFTFDSDRKELLESEFEVERLDEVGELLTEGRHETIQFAGIFMQVNGTNYVSGLTVLFPANLQVPDNGVAVIVTGRTNAQGFVELESIELLPDGVFVPVGQPVEVETESESNSNSEGGTNSGSDPNSNEGSGEGVNSGSGSGSSGNSNEPDIVDKPEHRDDFEVEGVIESVSETTLVINGKTVYLDNATIVGKLAVGAKVEIKGYYAEDGKFIVTEVKVKESESSGNRDNSGSGSGSDSNDDNSDSNTNDNSNNNDSNDNDSNDNDSNDNDSNNND